MSLGVDQHTNYRKTNALFLFSVRCINSDWKINPCSLSLPWAQSGYLPHPSHRTLSYLYVWAWPPRSPAPWEKPAPHQESTGLSTGMQAEGQGARGCPEHISRTEGVSLFSKVLGSYGISGIGVKGSLHSRTGLRLRGRWREGLETDLRVGAGAVSIETRSLFSWRLSRPRGLKR